jgi:hypothetical protein
MQLWADIFSAAGSRLGDGPIRLQDAMVTRVLDGIGSGSFSVPYTDQRAIDLLQNEAHAHIYYRATDGGADRLLGRMVIRKIRVEVTDAGLAVAACDGPDDLDGLTRVNTKMGRMYSEMSVEDIVDDLVALVSGWSATASGGNTMDARLDGVNIFKALMAVAEQQGLHVRAGSTAKTVEVGAFGSSSGMVLINPAQMTPALDANDAVSVIERLSIEQDSEAICTRLFPFGAGIGDALLTIHPSTRNLPYTIQIAEYNGEDHYFLEDIAAVAEFGVIEKVGKFSNIAPLSNSETDVENAANALYDIAAAWLGRYCQRLDAYRVTVRKVNSTIRPGDKVRLVYNGVVERDGARARYIEVDDEFWVSEVTERVGVEGQGVDLLLVSVDRQIDSTAKTVIGSLEELTLDGVLVSRYFNRVAWVFDRVIDPFHPAVCPVNISNATQRVSRVLIKLKTRSFISTVAPSVTNTTHRHTWATEEDAYTGPFYYRPVGFYDSESETGVFALLPVSVPTDTFNLQTGTETDEDFITISYGLQEDTQTPVTVSVYVNGVDRTSALGGTWGGTPGTELDLELDITEWIEGASPLHQEHEVEIRCVSGQGEVEVTVEVLEIIQAIKMT